jgi:hypothetical protein
MNMFEGRGIVQAGAEFIDNDNYAMEFNRKFFINGARPAGFLETDVVAEAQIEAIKVGFAEVREDIDNMQRIAVLAKGVKWSENRFSPPKRDHSLWLFPFPYSSQEKSQSKSAGYYYFHVRTVAIFEDCEKNKGSI